MRHRFLIQRDAEAGAEVAEAFVEGMEGQIDGRSRCARADEDVDEEVVKLCGAGSSSSRPSRLFPVSIVLSSSSI
ncbi:MAG: hypothetical protein U0793_09460 [Gemmataceae bacterium]